MLNPDSNTSPLTREHSSSGQPCSRADRCCISENLLHARIGLKRFALHDADGGERSHDFRAEGTYGFLLNQFVDQFKVAEIARWDSVNDQAAAFMELGRSLGAEECPIQFVFWSARQCRLPLQCRADAGAKAAGDIADKSSRSPGLARQEAQGSSFSMKERPSMSARAGRSFRTK